MADIYKAGDRVIYLGKDSSWYNEECEVLSFSASDGLRMKRLSNGEIGIERDLSKIKLISKNMNIKEKFALALTKEPMKSFRKVGITNGDNLLTEDGMNIFLSWLLNTKFADEFKKDVVDDMIKEVEDKE